MPRFYIPNMGCGGCARTVTKVLMSADPKARVETDPPTREVRVDSDLEERALLAVLSGAGYPHTQSPEATREI
ncbi:heavy-metal-associated domain-containing protein [Massilia sp. GCM10020059]|uniref:Heavy-metal-associated domain-containing protein n=1 Tax=Massilia agrisoli TaxID=2892444 RepID=A0ABS8IYB0_9BURK|nr:heavy-metal-associated domain-containing protein [Massilia agrisoli]